MAMTVRLPEELDAQLDAVARARHTSKHALIVEAAHRFLTEEAKTELAVAVAEKAAGRYAELLGMLEDA